MSIRNNVTLIGRLTKDPDLKYTPNGVPVANITLAVQRDRKNPDGNYESDFPNVVVWQKPAESLTNICRKGDLVGIHGRIQTRSYESEGRKVYVTEIVSNSVDFLRVKAWENGSGKANSQFNSNNLNHNQQYQDPFKNDGNIDIHDDDLPF